MEERIAEIVAGFARRLRFDPEALREANRKQAMVPRGAAAIDPAGTAPGLVVPTDGPTVIVLPGPPRELHEMWPHALETTEARAVLEGLEPYRNATVRMFGIPESELAKTLREIGGEVDLSPLEITTCLRRAELEVEIRYRPGRRGGLRAPGGGDSWPTTAGSCSAWTALRSTSRSRSSAAATGSGWPSRARRGSWPLE